MIAFRKVAELVTQMNQLDKDNQSLLDELQTNIPALFSKRKLLEVYDVDYENGELFCENLNETQKTVRSLVLFLLVSF